jgi:hypothetical protein
MNTTQPLATSTTGPPPVTPPTSPGPSPGPDESSQFSLQHLVEASAEPREPDEPSHSGIIDLSRMSTALRGSTAEPVAPWADPAQRLLPTPSTNHGGWLDRRLSTPLPPPSIGVGWLYGIIGVLSGALMMLLLGLIWTSDQVATRDVSSSQLTLSEARWDPNTLSYAVIPTTVPRPVVAPPIAATEPVAAEAPAQKERAKPRSSSKARPKVASTKPRTPVTKPQPKPKPKANLSVDCILDPASCGRGQASTMPAAPSSKPSEALPTKLGSSQIKAALASAKREARTCREMHGARTGTKVSVRLSIDGKTGRVTSAKPRAPHTNALGACVANKLATATFPRFTNSAMGVVYSVRM